MFYAHKGSAYDNAFTIDQYGQPTREFVGFETKKARRDYQNEVFNNSNDNVIFCSRRFVEKYLGRDFYVSESGFCFRND